MLKITVIFKMIIPKHLNGHQNGFYNVNIALPSDTNQYMVSMFATSAPSSFFFQCQRCLEFVADTGQQTIHFVGQKFRSFLLQMRPDHLPLLERRMP